MGKVRHTAVAPTVAPIGRLTAQFIELRDSASFEELVRRYSGFIYSVAYQVTADRHDAEDATQIAFLHLAIALKSGKKIDKPVGWLESVARKQAMRVIRGKSRLRRREQKVSKSETQVAQQVDPADEAAVAGIVRDALDDLPEHYRLPLVLHYFGGMSLETIAAELKTNPSTVGTRLHRGRKMLGHRLGKLGLHFDSDALSLLVASLIPAAIAKTILRNVTITPNAPPALAASIIQTIHVSLGMVMRRKLRLATLILATAAMSAALAKSFKGFSFPHIDLRGMIQRVEDYFSPSVQAFIATDNPGIPSPEPISFPTTFWAPDVSIRAGISPKTKPRNSFIDSGSNKTTSTPAASSATPSKEGIPPIIKHDSSTLADDLFAPHDHFVVSPVDPQSSSARRLNIPKKLADSPESSRPDPELLSTGSDGRDVSGRQANIVVPPFQQGGQKLRGFGNLDITGSFVENGRIVADGEGSHQVLNLSGSAPVQNTIENPPDGSNGWYAVNGGKLTLPALHVTSEDQTYTWGESASDPQLGLVNSLRLIPRGLTRGGDVSISLMTLADNEQQFASLPSGWGVVGLWQIDRGGMQANAIDLTIRYNQIAAAYLPANDQLLTFLTYVGQWNAMPFDLVQLDRADHLIEGTLDGQFDYFAVAGPLDPETIPSNVPLFSVLTPEPTIGVFPLLALLVCRRRRQHLNAAPAPAAMER